MKWLLSVLVIATISSVAEAQRHRVWVVDNRIVLDGTFEQLAAIEATSHAGRLSLHEIETGPPLDSTLPDTSPFPLDVGIVLVNEPTWILFGVLGADNRVDVDGVTVKHLRFR